MNPLLARLQPYPFDRLRTRLAGIASPAFPPIRLSIGEPRHATPELVRRALVDHPDGLSTYPLTAGLDQLREASHRMGRDAFRNLIVFTSLSKRSNAPGLRPGAVAGDAALLRQFLPYRTYHGYAMNPAVQPASIAAWSDRASVRENQECYRAKFAAVVPMLQPVLDVHEPDAGFNLRARVPGDDDERFAGELFAATHVTVLPGRYLARETHGLNPGGGCVRMALVADVRDCVEGVRRIVDFCR